MGSLTCAHNWVRAVHTKGSQTQTIKSAQELIRQVSNTDFDPVPLGDRTQGLLISILTL